MGPEQGGEERMVDLQGKIVQEVIYPEDRGRATVVTLSHLHFRRMALLTIQRRMKAAVSPEAARPVKRLWQMSWWEGCGPGPWQWGLG